MSGLVLAFVLVFSSVSRAATIVVVDDAFVAYDEVTRVWTLGTSGIELSFGLGSSRPVAPAPDGISRHLPRLAARWRV